MRRITLDVARWVAGWCVIVWSVFTLVALLPGIRRRTHARTCTLCRGLDHPPLVAGPAPRGPDAWDAARQAWAGTETYDEAVTRGAAIRREMAGAHR